MTAEGKKKLETLTQEIEKISDRLKELSEEERGNISDEEHEEEVDTLENIGEWLSQHNDDLKEILWEK